MQPGRELQRTGPVVMAPSVDDVAFLIVAIRKHAETYRRNGAAVPAGVWELEAAFTSRVTQGQDGSTFANAAQGEQVVPMTPRLVRYGTAGQLLAMSMSTLKRRIKAGDFHPIDLGNGPRIRVSEIDEQIAAAGSARMGA